MAAVNDTRRGARSAVLVVLATVLASAAAIAQDEIYRWVDDKGEVHYGAVLPPQYANRPHQILRNGLVIKSVEDPMAVVEAEEAAQPKQEQDPVDETRARLRDTDRLLLLKYRSEEEIVEAMELEVANLDYDARQIEQERANAQSALASQIREAADRQRAGMPDDAQLTGQIVALRKRLLQNSRNHNDLEVREAQIREMFQIELRRYRFLEDGGGLGEPFPEETAAESSS